MNIQDLNKQGWHITDWDKTIPEIGDYIQQMREGMESAYSFQITAIGEQSFLAINLSRRSTNPEMQLNKFDKVYVFKKKGSGHPLINGIDTEKEIHT